jgi:isocitrate dehydrogenase
VLFSLHLKATMMKVSDPIIFGHAVRAFFPALFAQHGPMLEAAGINPNDGLGTMLQIAATVPDDQRAIIEAAVAKGIADGPALAMVDSDRGITNLHVPSDTIVDASMPAMIRSSGKMWNAEGERAGHQGGAPRQLLCRGVPGDDRRLPGQRRLRPHDHGVGAQRRPHGAEGRGVRQRTTRPSRSPHDGTVRVVDGSGATVLERRGRGGRHLAHACQTKDLPIRDWVRLAVRRARASGAPAVFWLDAAPGARRPADHQGPRLARRTQDTDGLQIEIMSPVEATPVSAWSASAAARTPSR